MMFSLSVKPTYALFGVGDIVFDPAAFGQFIISQATRIGQFAKETITAASNVVGDAASSFNSIQQNIIRPVQDALMIASVISSSNKIKTLVLGSVGGQTSLLITNPQFYLKQQGVNSLKISVGSVATANGVYSNSILNSIVLNSRVNSDPSGALANCANSSIPSTIQKNLCEDSQLTKIAINDVMASDGSYILSTMTARKAEIYNKLCIGNPATDKALAQALTTAGKQTGAGGWDTWLATTGGDNEYAKTNNCLAIAAQQQAAMVAAKAADLQRGNGIISKTECLMKVTNPATGEQDCVEESITQAGYQLSEAFKTAIGAPLQTIMSSIGTGAGGFGASLTSLLSNIGQLLGSVNSIRNSVNSIQGSAAIISSNLGGTGGDPRLQITLKGQTAPGTLLTVTSTSTNPNTPVTSTSAEQDLAGNPMKTQLTNPIFDQLNKHLATLSTLKTTDNQYLTAIAEYTSYIEGVRSCYQGLVTSFPQKTFAPVNGPGYYAGQTFPSLANDQRVIEALAYYATKKTSTDKLKTDITTELSLVDQTKTLVTTTQTSIANSNSTQEISTLFDTYNTTVTNRNLPSFFTGTLRDADIMTYKENTASAVADYTGVTGAESMTGKIAQLNNQCRAIRTEEQAKRDAAQAAQDEAKTYSAGGGY